MICFRNREGFVKPILCIALLAVAAYSGFQFGMPYYRSAAFRSEVREIVRVELGNAEIVKTRVYQSATGFHVPVKEDDIQVVKKERTVQVMTSWTEDVNIFGLYRRTLHFNLNVEE